MLNPLFNHFQFSMTILMPSFFAFIFFYERLLSLKQYGPNNFSYFLIIPICFLFLHYGVPKIFGLIIFFYFIVQIFYNFNNKRNITFFYKTLYLLIFVIFISILLLTVSSYKNLLIIFHPINFFLGINQEIFLLDGSNNATSLLNSLKYNFLIIYESFFNINLFNFISNNAHYISADFRYELFNKLLFVIFLIGLIILLHKFIITKKKFSSDYFDIIFLLLVCLIPHLASSVYTYNDINKSIVSTLSSQRLFIIIFPLYLVIALFVNELLFFIKNVSIKIILLSALIIQSVFIINNNYNHFIFDAESIDYNLSINQSNLLWSKKTLGSFDRKRFQHLHLHFKYKKITSKICNEFNNKKNNHIFKINLNNFINNLRFPPSLPYLDGFNFHLVFLSLYLSDCGISNAWFQITDNNFSLRKVGFTEFRNYSAQLSKENNFSYIGKNLFNNLRDYNLNNINIIATTDHELKLAIDLLKKSELKFKYFEYN